MKCDYVSRDAIRAMEIGETRIFELPNIKKLVSARVQFSTMEALEGMEFEKINVGEPLTIARKRIK